MRPFLCAFLSGDSAFSKKPSAGYSLPHCNWEADKSNLLKLFEICCNRSLQGLEISVLKKGIMEMALSIRTRFIVQRAKEIGSHLQMHYPSSRGGRRNVADFYNLSTSLQKEGRNGVSTVDRKGQASSNLSFTGFMIATPSERSDVGVFYCKRNKCFGVMGLEPVVLRP
jgi:hypothetical protein